MEKLWGRYSLLKADDLQGVRLQSELRGLLAKMAKMGGGGADIDSVLEERDRLSVKLSQAGRSNP